MIPQDKILEVQNAVDIVEIIGEYLPLSRAGRLFKACCPFHSEKTPSFFVDPDKQFFKCYGCGEGGNVFSFLMKRDGLSFPEAVEAMAERGGVKLPRYERSKDSGDGTGDLFEVLAEAASFYGRMLFDDKRGEKALSYVAGRKLGTDVSKRFVLGCAPDAWDALLVHMRKRHEPETLEKAGLVRRRREGDGFYDYFRDRLMFPIHDNRARVVGFGARSLDGSEPKYLNSPEGSLFQKSRILYGLHLAKDAVIEKGMAVVCEGYTDVMKCHESGFANAVATLGTAFGEAHARTLKRFTEKVLVLFDADAAGQKAAEASLDFLVGADLEVKVVTLPGGKDPCDFLVEDGPEAFAAELQKGRDVFKFKLETARKKIGGDSAHAHEKVISSMLELAGRISDPVRRDIFLGRLSAETGVLRHMLDEKLALLSRRMRRGGPVYERPADEAEAIAEVRKSECDAAEWELVECMLNSPEIVPQAIEVWPPEKFTRGDLGELARAVAVLAEERGEFTAGEVVSVVSGTPSEGVVKAMLSSGEDGRDVRASFDQLVRKLEQKELDKKITTAREEYRAASREGDDARFNECWIKYNQLVKKRDRLRK